MWIELLLILLILWLFYRSFKASQSTLLLEKNNLKLIKQRLENIAEAAQMSLPGGFQVQETTKHPYTKNKTVIYLPLQKANGSSYESNDIMHVAVHELAHVLSPSRDTYTHGPVFSAIEDQLKQIASKLGYLDLKKPVSHDYPCAQ